MDILFQAVVYLAAALIAVPLCKWLGFGSVLGYLAAGMLIGPWGLRLTDNVEDVLHFAEIGVVFLLFVIGLELQPSRLWVLRNSVFINGSAQMLAAAIPLTLVAHWLGLDWTGAAVVGSALALSSTAFVLQALAEKRQMGKAHGRAAFGIMLFQDIAVIPLLALLPLLGSGADEAATQPFWWQLLKVLAVLGGLVLGGRVLLRPVLRMASRFGSEETFVAAALLLVIGAASLMHWAELSMGLGAFLAGMLLADSEYRHELEASINPFKGLLLGLFFISVGMSADFGLLASDLPLITFGLVTLVTVKIVGLYGVSRLLGLPHATARNLCLVLAQGGEFAFVLLHAAVGEQLLPTVVEDRLIMIVILSMVVTPFLFMLGDWLTRRDDSQQPAPEYDDIDADATPVIIAGFGRVGQMIGRILHMRGIAFTALERDAEHVDLVRRFGNRIYYGDPGSLETLRAARAGEARLLVLALDDVELSVRCAELARRHFPDLKVFARARNRAHALRLMDIGVDYLIRETLVSSLELGHAVLRGLGDDAEMAERSIRTFREADESLLQRQLALREDEAQLVQSAQQVRDELQSLFERDPQLMEHDLPLEKLPDSADNVMDEGAVK